MDPIDISSDDDLPNIIVNGVQRRRNSSTSTIICDLEDKENINDVEDDVVDLTQGCDAELVLSGSSNKSLTEIDRNVLGGAAYSAHKRSESLDSVSTIDLNFNQNDAMFDELLAVNKVTNVSEEVSSLASVGVTSASASTSSGYSSGISKGGQRRSVDSTKSKSRKKTSSSDRISKKQKLAEEKAARQAANELNKVYKPGECMKYMRINLHPSLSKAWFMSDLTRELDGSGVSVEECAEMCHERAVVWTRRKGGRRIEDNRGQMALSDKTEPCDHAILILTAEEIAPIVAERGLAKHVGNIKQMTGCEMTLAVFGVKEYFKSASKKKKNQGKNMNEIEMEMAFTDLLVTSSIDVQILDSPSELALFLVHTTKSIAEQRYKLAKREIDEQAEFYMRADSKNCVKVDKDGNGLSRLWQQMIAVLPQSSLEVSRAVCSKYKSPLELYEACTAPNAILSLSETPIDRANLPSARQRRLGAEFSRKLHELLTAQDGDTLIE